MTHCFNIKGNYSTCVLMQYDNRYKLSNPTTTSTIKVITECIPNSDSWHLSLNDSCTSVMATSSNSSVYQCPLIFKQITMYFTHIVQNTASSDYSWQELDVCISHILCKIQQAVTIVDKNLMSVSFLFIKHAHNLTGS